MWLRWYKNHEIGSGSRSYWHHFQGGGRWVGAAERDPVAGQRLPGDSIFFFFFFVALPLWVSHVSVVARLSDTFFSWKKIGEIISVTATNYQYQHCACKRLLRTDAKLSFRAFRVERQWWASYSSWHISLGLENIGLIIKFFLAIMTSAPRRSICRLGKYSPVYTYFLGLGNHGLYIYGLPLGSVGEIVEDAIASNREKHFQSLWVTFTWNWTTNIDHNAPKHPQTHRCVPVGKASETHQESAVEPLGLRPHEAKRSCQLFFPFIIWWELCSTNRIELTEVSPFVPMVTGTTLITAICVFTGCILSAVVLFIFAFIYIWKSKQPSSEFYPRPEMRALQKQSEPFFENNSRMNDCINKTEFGTLELCSPVGFTTEVDHPASLTRRLWHAQRKLICNQNLTFEQAHSHTQASPSISTKTRQTFAVVIAVRVYTGSVVWTAVQTVFTLVNICQQRREVIVREGKATNHKQALDVMKVLAGFRSTNDVPFLFSNRSLKQAPKAVCHGNVFWQQCSSSV